MSVNEANPSDLDLLRQRISELEAELEKKNVELEEERRRSDSELMKQINELRNEKAVLHAKNYDLEIEVAKLRKDHGSRIEELEKKACEVEQSSSVEQPQNERFKGHSVDVPNTVVDLPDDAKLEQDSDRVASGSVVDEQSQDAEDGKVFLLREGFAGGASHNSSNDNTPHNNSSNFNSGAVHHEKSSQEKEMDIFLDGEDKKIVGEDIRRRNKEKKLQRESAGQDSSSDTAYVSGTVNNIEKTDVPKTTNRTSSELSHETEVIEDIGNSAVDSNTINDRSASENSEEIGKTVSLGYDRVASESMEEIESKVDPVPLGPHQDKSVVGPGIVTESVQGLLEELLSDNDQLQTIKFSSPRTIVPGSISIKRLANSFCQANGARNRSITAKRAEITAWRLFSERFENKVLELRSENKKLADRIARTQIYAEMKPYLTGISDEYLRVRTSRARKINKLFGFEYDPVTLKKIDGIPGYMVNRVTCSADRISKLTNPQIEYIIEQVKSKSVNDQSHVTETFPPVDESTDIAEGATNMISDDGSFHFFYDDPGDSNRPTANIDTAVNDVEDIVTRKIFDDSSEDEDSQNETSASSSNSNSDSDSVSDSGSDYDESMEQLHDDLTREEMVRLKALPEALSAESAPPIKIFNDLKIFDDDFFSDEPIDSNHPINAQGIAVQA